MNYEPPMSAEARFGFSIGIILMLLFACAVIMQKKIKSANPVIVQITIGTNSTQNILVSKKGGER